jgi:hypothetical protein
MVNPGPSMRQLRLQESKKRNRPNKRSHPADIREGVAAAFTLVKEVSIHTFLIKSLKLIYLVYFWDTYKFLIKLKCHNKLLTMVSYLL